MLSIVCRAHGLVEESQVLGEAYNSWSPEPQKNMGPTTVACVCDDGFQLAGASSKYDVVLHVDVRGFCTKKCTWGWGVIITLLTAD